MIDFRNLTLKEYILNFYFAYFDFRHLCLFRCFFSLKFRSNFKLIIGFILVFTFSLSLFIPLHLDILFILKDFKISILFTLLSLKVYLSIQLARWYLIYLDKKSPIQKWDLDVLETFPFKGYLFQEMGASNFRKAFYWNVDWMFPK